MKLNIDYVDDNLILYGNSVVMTRGEEPYFKLLFSELENLQPFSVLEVGFGLGISAELIQKKLRPKLHLILEIEDTIGAKAEIFANNNVNVKICLCNWIKYQTEEKFDFIFYDPFDYAEIEHIPRNDVAKKLDELLVKNGVVSHPHFGDGDVNELAGFNYHILNRHKIHSFETGDGHICNDVASIIRYRDNDDIDFILDKIKRV